MHILVFTNGITWINIYIYNIRENLCIYNGITWINLCIYNGIT